jgi:hypothetical protein
LESLRASVNVEEKRTVDRLLTTFIAQTGFNNGLDSFLGILSTQLGLPDIILDTASLRKSMDQFFACRVYCSYLQAIFPGRAKDIEDLEFKYQNQLLTSMLGLNKVEDIPPKKDQATVDSTEEIAEQLRRDLVTFLKDFSKELVHSNKGSKETLNAFLKDLKGVLKSNIRGGKKDWEHRLE